jgi:hypothetical protein
MDPAVQRALNDKLYDKRKVGALELVALQLPHSIFLLCCREPALLLPFVIVTCWFPTSHAPPSTRWSTPLDMFN